MTIRVPLRPQSAIKALRQDIGSAEDFDHDGQLHQRAVQFFDDLVIHLAGGMGFETEDARMFLLRCMGAVAHINSAAAYVPHGFEDPFKQPIDELMLEDPRPFGLPPARLAPQWEWPVIHQPPPGRGGGSFIDRSMNPFSALKLFGYTVGKADGWSQAKRQSFLRDFMAMTLPPIVNATFGEDYGAPMTMTRLKKVANVIATNASNFYRNDPAKFEVAIADWEDDLGFLYREFYLGAKLAFAPWPATRPAAARPTGGTGRGKAGGRGR